MVDRKHNEVNMDWIEIIQLKSFTGQDRDSAVAAFQQLSAPLSDASLREIVQESEFGKRTEHPDQLVR
jgi:hypothetical protein